MSFPWVARFSSRSALGPPHDGVRRARRLNLFHDLGGILSHRFETLNEIAWPIVPTGTIRIPEFASGAVPILLRASADGRPQSAKRAFPCRGSAPASTRRAHSQNQRTSGLLHLPADRPHKGRKFTSNRRTDNRRLLAASCEMPVSRSKTRLSFPRYVPYLGGDLLQPIKFLCANPRRMAIRPGALDEHISRAAIACLGDAASLDRRAC